MYKLAFTISALQQIQNCRNLKIITLTSQELSLHCFNLWLLRNIIGKGTDFPDATSLTTLYAFDLRLFLFNSVITHRFKKSQHTNQVLLVVLLESIPIHI